MRLLGQGAEVPEFAEFLIEDRLSLDEAAALLTRILERPVTGRNGIEDLDGNDGAAVILFPATGAMNTQCLVTGLNDGEIVDEDFYAAIGDKVGCALLIVDDSTENPFFYRLRRGGVWATVTIDEEEEAKNHHWILNEVDDGEIGS